MVIFMFVMAIVICVVYRSPLLFTDIIKVKKDCLWKQRTHKITKIGDSV